MLGTLYRTGDARLYSHHGLVDIAISATSHEATLVTVPSRRDRAVGAQIDITSIPGRFVLSSHSSSGDRAFEVDGRPSFSSATAWERSVRRVENVRFCDCDDAWRADIEVVGHRIPTRHPIPVGTAIALGLRGHRLTMCAESLIDELDMKGVADGRVSL